MAGKRSPAKKKRRESADLSYGAVAHQYARDVVEGRIPACKWARLACQRHLRDLAREKEKGFPYKFDSHKAARACRFIELMPHIKGQWARPEPGKHNRIKMEPWQVFKTCGLFGWVWKTSGLRRFSEAYICIPRKNAKSTWAAAVGNYMLAADGEYGAEVYSGATSEKQAWEVFRPAWRMVRRTPQMEAIFGVQWAAKSLYIEEDGGRFEPLIGDPGDGASPSCAIVDEYHEHNTASQYDTMKTGMGARSQPLLLVITTAGSNIAGPCHDLQIEAQKVLEGIVENDEFFAIIYTIDESDDWTTPEVLKKANPNFDVSVFGKFLEKQQREAMQQASKQNVFKTKHLNIWVGAAAGLYNMEQWRACHDPNLSLEEFVGQEYYEGDDLSNKIDLTSRVLVFLREIEGKRHYYVFAKSYLPAERAMDPRCQHYQRWVHEGLLVPIPGAEIDYGVIKRDILADTLRFKLRRLAFDPWGALQLQQELKKELGNDSEGQEVVTEVPQQTRFLSEPMKEIEAAMAGGRLHHTGDKVLTWCMSNVVLKPDMLNGNYFPRKEREENKIDAHSAFVNAMRWASVATPKKKSVYSSRGLVTL